MDLGPCPKMHSEKVATAFKAARAAAPADPRFAAFEQEYQNNLYAFIEDCDRKIRMSQRRLEKTPEENAKGVNLVRAEWSEAKRGSEALTNEAMTLQMREIGEIELAIQSETEEVESLGAWRAAWSSATAAQAAPRLLPRQARRARSRKA